MSDDPFAGDDPAARARATAARARSARRSGAAPSPSRRRRQVAQATSRQAKEAAEGPELRRPAATRAVAALGVAVALGAVSSGSGGDRRARLPPLPPQHAAAAGRGADDHGDHPRGLHRAPDRGNRQAGRPARQLREGQRALQVPQSGQVRRQGRQGPRGLPLPRHLRTGEARQRRRPGPAPARRLQAPDRGRQHGLRALEEPDGLRRGHDRLDDRARGRPGKPAQAGRGGDLQPPARRACRWGSTRRPASPPATTRGR